MGRPERAREAQQQQQQQQRQSHCSHRPRLSRWLLAGLMCCTAASAQKPSPESPVASELKARSLAATCAACHGTDGQPIADHALPALAGRPAKELSELLHAFKSGQRPGTVMPQLAKGYDEAQIDMLARYFSTRPAATAPGPQRAKPSHRQGAGAGTALGATP